MDNYSHRMVPEVFETFWSGIAVAGPGLTAVKTVRGVGQHFGDQIEVASRVSCPPARRGRGLTCLGRKGEDRMHFTFFYDGAAERTAEYPTLEEAVRSIELG